MGTPEHGWYDFEGRRRYWDGEQWTDRYLDEEEPAPAPPPPPSGPRYDPAMDAKAAPELQPRKTNWWPWACGGCVVVPMLIIALAFAFSDGTDQSPYDPDNVTEAVEQCEDLVTQQLRSPSTADFDSTGSSTGSGTWTVTGTVDSQNGFGAQVRSSYGCTMRVTNGKIERRLDYLG